MIPKTIVILAVAGGGIAVAATSMQGAAASRDGVQVQLCDGETRLDLAAAPTTRAEGQAVASALMAEWQQKNPDQPLWALANTAPPAGPPAGPPVGLPVGQGPASKDEALLYQRFQPMRPFDNRYLLGEGQREGHPYRLFEERDITLWERDTMNFVLEGAQVFHDARRLGSTIAVSCDMCHPDAANTHPETYPKYQTQIGRTVMLREMINWCIEHPVRGTKLAHDDPRMLAMEAYIHAQRRGVELQFGKH